MGQGCGRSGAARHTILLGSIQALTFRVTSIKLSQIVQRIRKLLPVERRCKFKCAAFFRSIQVPAYLQVVVVIVTSARGSFDFRNVSVLCDVC
jgi:hypothetical protein